MKEQRACCFLLAAACNPHGAIVSPASRDTVDLVASAPYSTMTEEAQICLTKACAATERFQFSESGPILVASGPFGDRTEPIKSRPDAACSKNGCSSYSSYSESYLVIQREHPRVSACVDAVAEVVEDWMKPRMLLPRESVAFGDAFRFIVPTAAHEINGFFVIRFEVGPSAARLLVAHKTTNDNPIAKARLLSKVRQLNPDALLASMRQRAVACLETGD